MARPRTFDETAVLEAAIRRFWSRGYEATSMRELTAEMGITSASLYNTFGDKRSLYQRSLAHYIEHSFAERVQRLEGKMPPREALAAFFDEVVERSLGDPQRKGCMLVNSALELAPHDPVFRQVVADVLDRIEGFFRRSIVAGQRDGSIGSDAPPDDLARLLLSQLMGIRVLARARPERELLTGAMRALLALLDT